MRKIIIVIVLFCIFGNKIFGQNPLFDDTKLPSVFVEMSPDSFNIMIDNIISDHYLTARFIFDNGIVRDTVEKVGIRIRGNTSLMSQKKSFKISFNAFQNGGKYRGVKKLNFNGSHNDPSMIREKLFYDIWNKAKMPKRRVNFVKLFINNEYRGLYTNAEEIDKEWLERVFDEKNGNLYKCTYPADLVYSGSNPDIYKNIYNNSTTRAYDLTTNETADDYTDLVGLIAELGNNSTTFEAKIQQKLNVNLYLKALAIDVATGNWDDYAYNKNNFYLYHDSLTNKFNFITYDTDNTIGIDWLGKNWAKRNVYKFQHSTDPRPLVTKLLAVPSFKLQYTKYLDTIARLIIHPDSIFPCVDFLHNLIKPAAIDDVFRTLDYGYSINDFDNSFTETIDNHTPYGIKPFFTLRRDSILAQIKMMLSTISATDVLEKKWTISPNPFHDFLEISDENLNPANNFGLEIFDVYGKKITVWTLKIGNSIQISTNQFQSGVYFLKYKKDVFRVVRI
jgi:CotH kinase protein/Secretion system C-terminal sorting domain